MKEDNYLLKIFFIISHFLKLLERLLNDMLIWCLQNRFKKERKKKREYKQINKQKQTNKLCALKINTTNFFFDFLPSTYNQWTYRFHNERITLFRSLLFSLAKLFLIMWWRLPKVLIKTSKTMLRLLHGNVSLFCVLVCWF